MKKIFISIFQLLLLGEGLAQSSKGTESEWRIGVFTRYIAVPEVREVPNNPSRYRLPKTISDDDPKKLNKLIGVSIGQQTKFKNNERLLLTWEAAFGMGMKDILEEQEIGTESKLKPDWKEIQASWGGAPTTPEELYNRL